MGKTLMEIHSPAIDPQNGIAVELLDSARVVACWPYIEDMLLRVPHTWQNYTVESLLQMAVRGQIQVWLVGGFREVNLVIFTKIAVFPTMRVLEIFWTMGLGMLKVAGVAVDGALEHFAAEQGCSEIRAVGRGGWEKILEPWGFKKVAVILSRPVIERSVQ
jgi:hypothetical protein